MQIRRDRSRLTFRKRRRGGFLPFALLLGVIFGVAAFSWDRIEQWLNAAPGQPDVNLQAVEQAFARGDLDATIDFARQLFDSNPEQAESLLWLTRALIYRSYTDYDRAIDRETALELTTNSLQRMPGSRDVMAIHAFALQANGQPASAARLAQRVLDREPNNPLARLVLALSYGGVGAFEIALRENRQAAEDARLLDRAMQVDVLRALAISYSDLGRYQDAIETVERAIDLNDHLIPLYFELALYALHIGDADAATVAYFQVLAYDSGNVKARLRMCELSSLLREHDTAVRYCTEVIELAPDWAEGWYHLGREHFLQSDFRTAQEYLHRCSSLQVMQGVPVEERRFECWYLQGQAAEIIGDCEGLLATYNEFRAMAADDALRETWTYPPEGPPGCVAASSE